VEKIRTGNTNIRNPILVSFIAKGLLPYHGLGSGIPRALGDWPDILFTDDRDGCLFTATVYRNSGEKVNETSEKRAPLYIPRKTSEKTVVLPGSTQKTSEKVGESPKSTQKTSGKTVESLKCTQKSTQKIIELIQRTPTITRTELAERVGITDAAIKKQLAKLKAAGMIIRIGPDKGGHWEVIENG